jgi:hypothetical protein
MCFFEKARGTGAREERHGQTIYAFDDPDYNSDVYCYGFGSTAYSELQGY